MTFAQRFGELSVGHPVEPTLADLPEVQPIDSLKDRTNFWHTDVTFMARPARPDRCCGRSRCRTSAATRCGATRVLRTRRWRRTVAHVLRRALGVHYDEYYAAVIANGDANEWDGVKLERLVPARAPGRACPSRDAATEPVREPEASRSVCTTSPSSRVESVLALLYEHMTQPRVHRPLPLEAGHDRVLGQPRHDALRRLRLRRHAPDHASRDPPRRRAGRTLVGSLRTS